MYTPLPYVEDDLQTLHAAMREWSFAVLVTAGTHGVKVSHLPFLLDAGTDAEDTPLGILTTHLSKKNPQFGDLRAGCEATVIFQGPHAYITPSWYERQGTFPTWNYCAVHAGGMPRVVDDRAGVHAVLRRTVAHYDTPVAGAWDFDAMPFDFVAPRLDMIAVVEIPLTRLEGKFKLNQDRSAQDRQGVIDALERAGGIGMPAELAQMMRARMPVDEST